MIVGTIISNSLLFQKNPAWQLMFLPFRSGEIVKIHVMVIIMPFLCLLARVLFKNSYQPLTITRLLAIFYLFPAAGKKISSPAAASKNNSTLMAD